MDVWSCHVMSARHTTVFACCDRAIHWDAVCVFQTGMGAISCGFDSCGCLMLKELDLPERAEVNTEQHSITLHCAALHTLHLLRVVSGISEVAVISQLVC